MMGHSQMSAVRSHFRWQKGSRGRFFTLLFLTDHNHSIVSSAQEFPLLCPCHQSGESFGALLAFFGACLTGLLCFPGRRCHRSCIGRCWGPQESQCQTCESGQFISLGLMDINWNNSMEIKPKRYLGWGCSMLHLSTSLAGIENVLWH